MFCLAFLYIYICMNRAVARIIWSEIYVKIKHWWDLRWSACSYLEIHKHVLLRKDHQKNNKAKHVLEDFRLIHRQIITKPKFHDCSFWVEISAVGLEKRAKAFQKQSCPQINLASIGCTNLFASLHDLLSYQSRLAQLL